MCPIGNQPKGCAHTEAGGHTFGFVLQDEDEEDDDSLDGDDEMFGYQAMLRAKRKPKVVIEDVTDREPEVEANGKAATAKKGKKKGEVRPGEFPGGHAGGELGYL